MVMANREPLAAEVPAEGGERDDEHVDESAVAAFGEWYESQPPEWIAAMDAIGRKGPVTPGS